MSCSKISNKEIYTTLASLSTYQDTINAIAAKDMPIKKVCVISANSIQAWSVVISEFNDVITTLRDVNKLEDKIYKAAFSKALEIVMRATKYRKE